MYTVNLANIRCISERNESSASEEPYVLVTAVSLGAVSGVSLPSFDVYRYGVWEDTDAGETKINTGPPFWGTRAPANIPNPDSVIFIVSLMENDNGDPDDYRAFVKAAATASLGSTLTQPRAVKAETLLHDINDALNAIRVPIPFTLDDDHIGSFELRLHTDDLQSSPMPINRSQRISNREGNYMLNFIIRNHRSNYFSTPTTARGMGDVGVGPDGKVWLAGRNGTIWFTNDRGVSFAQIEASGFERVAVGPDNTLWAVGFNGTLWNFRAGVWTQTPASGMGDVAIGPDSKVWLAGRNGTIWFSNDHGARFDQIEASGSESLAVAPDNTIWVVKSDDTLWKFRRGH